MTSLAQYAAERGMHHGPGKWLDRLPPEVYDEVVAGWKAGLGQVVIIEWLKTKGYEDATQGKIAPLSIRFPRHEAS